MKIGLFVDHTDYGNSNAKVLEGLREEYEVMAFNHLGRVFNEINEDIHDELGRFDFLVTNLPRSESAEKQLQIIRDKRAAPLNSQQYKFFMKERMYQSALHIMKGIRQRRPEMAIVLYSGAPRFILEGALNDGIVDYVLPRPNYIGDLDREIDFIKKCIDGKFAPGRMA